MVGPRRYPLRHHIAASGRGRPASAGRVATFFAVGVVIGLVAGYMFMGTAHAILESRNASHYQEGGTAAGAGVRQQQQQQQPPGTATNAAAQPQQQQQQQQQQPASTAMDVGTDRQE